MDAMNDSTPLVNEAQEGITILMLHNSVIPLILFVVLKHDGNRVSAS